MTAWQVLPMTTLNSPSQSSIPGLLFGTLIGWPLAMMLATLLVKAAGFSGTGVFISFRCS